MKEKEITLEQKLAWLETASNGDLLRQLVSFEKRNEYGKLDADIDLVKAEILNRMAH